LLLSSLTSSYVFQHPANSTKIGKELQSSFLDQFTISARSYGQKGRLDHFLKMACSLGRDRQNDVIDWHDTGFGLLLRNCEEGSKVGASVDVLFDTKGLSQTEPRFVESRVRGYWSPVSRNA
jgi:hypothetical protein